jgi:hypothetical protein
LSGVGSAGGGADEDEGRDGWMEASVARVDERRAKRDATGGERVEELERLGCP